MADFGKPRFPSEMGQSAMRGPSLLSPALDKSLLHFCFTDFEGKTATNANASYVAPSERPPPKASRGRFQGLRAVRGSPVAPTALLPVREVARQLGVSTATVYRLSEQRELHHIRVSNAIRIGPVDLEAFLSRNKRTT